MDKENSLLNGKLSFTAVPDGSLRKNKAVYIHVQSQIPFFWLSTQLLQRGFLPLSKADHTGPFAKETPGQIYMRQPF